MFKQFIQKLGYFKIILLAPFVLGFLFFGNYILNVKAETKNAGPLKIEYPGVDPLFSATNIVPGYSETKTLTITNQGMANHSFAIAASGTLGDLAQVLHLAPKVSNIAVWDETIAALTDGNSHTILGSIAPGETKTVDLVAYLPASVDNNYQGKSTLTFDFIVGDEEPEPQVSILSSPGTAGGTGATGAGGIGGEVLGVSNPSPTVSPSPSPTGSIQGEEKSNGETRGARSYKFLYWLIPLIIILLILFFLWWRRRREDEEEEL